MLDFITKDTDKNDNSDQVSLDKDTHIAKLTSLMKKNISDKKTTPVSELETEFERIYGEVQERVNAKYENNFNLIIENGNTE